MPREQFEPDDPREWLARARGNMVIARSALPDVDLEELCFNAQQAAKKAIKAAMIHHDVRFPYIHDLAPLLEQLRQNGIATPVSVAEADRLSRYAVIARYPLPLAEQPSQADYEQAIAIAEAVLRWADGEIRPPGG